MGLLPYLERFKRQKLKVDRVHDLVSPKLCDLNEVRQLSYRTVQYPGTAQNDYDPFDNSSDSHSFSQNAAS